MRTPIVTGEVSPMELFPVVELYGGAEEVGFQHGALLSKRIERTFSYYQKLLSRFSSAELQRYAAQFKREIEAFCPQFVREIEAMAEGASIEPWKLYVLNARTEIHRSTKVPTECTSLFFHQSKLLGENWDWDHALEPLAVVLKITRGDGHKILTITEPGVVGKIGLNSAGIGVALNILKCKARTGKIPVHVLLRSVLECGSIDEALEMLRNAPRATMSNLMLADDTGRCFNVELAGGLIDELKSGSLVTIHTNHYIGCATAPDRAGSDSSFARYERASELVKDVRVLRKLEDKSEALSVMKEILLDQENSALPICRPFEYDSDGQEIGTLTSVVMDLERREIHMTKGAPTTNPFVTISL